MGHVHPGRVQDLTLLRAKCAEAPDEPERVSEEEALKLECNISINTNFLASGILDVSQVLMLSYKG